VHDVSIECQPIGPVGPAQPPLSSRYELASIHMSDSASGSGVTQAGLANKTVSCDGESSPQRFVANAKQ